MSARYIFSMLLAAVLLAAACASPPAPQHRKFPIESLRGMLFTPSQVAADARRMNPAGATNAIVLAIDEQSSYRAVANAMTLVRGRGLPVGYWIDVAKAPDASADFSTTFDRVQQLLSRLPRSDAIFIAGLQGEAAACGCGVHECCGPDSPARDVALGARWIPSIRSCAAGAIVVPVLRDGCAPESRNCETRGCTDDACQVRAAQAWNSIRAHSARVALLLERGPQESDPGIWTDMRLKAWSGLPGPALPSKPLEPASFVAVFSAQEFSPDDLARAVSSAHQMRRMGVLIDHTPASQHEPARD